MKEKTKTKTKDAGTEKEETTPKKEKYFEAVGRRKSAIARVRIFTKKSTDRPADKTDENAAEEAALITVNGNDYTDYFGKNQDLLDIAASPLKKLKSVNRFKASIKVLGGGIHSQAEAIRHGLSRALVMFDSNFAKKLKKSGFLTRDSREKERRKYGLKKARKAPQWAKR